MLSWKCRLYKVESGPSLQATITLNNPVLVKSDVPFNILTTPEDLSFNYNSGAGKDIQYLYSVATDLERILGEQYFLLYLTMTGPLNEYWSIKTDSGSTYKERCVAVFPSAVLAVPEAFEASHSNRFLVLELQQLPGRFLIYSGGSGGSVAVYTGDINGTLTRIAYDPQSEPGSRSYNFMNGINRFGFLYCKNFSSVTDIFDSSKIGTIRAQLDNLKESSYIGTISGGNMMVSVLKAWLTETPPDPEDPTIPTNPYAPGGSSGTTDPSIGPGNFDDSSDPITDSSLPTLSAANTGFTRIYNPTLFQVQQLAQYLWTTPDVITTIWNHIKQFFEDPMQAIIGFNLVPVPVPDGGTDSFRLMFIDTGIPMTVAANQFVDVDCGTVQIKRYYGSALDQSPFTKVSCFLPFIGTVNLNTDEVIGTTLQCKYRVDIVSGSCVAKILVDGNCIYQFSGHCAITIPFSSADFSSYVSAAISVGKLAAAALTAGASAAAAAGVEEVAQQTNQVVTTTQQSTAKFGASGEFRGATMMSKVETRESPADQSSTQASFSGLSPQNVANTVGQIMSSKPYIEHSGSFSGNSGYLGVRRPFLIIERPNMCMPENYQALNGFPSMITLDLSTCKGFTRVQQVQLTGLGATNPEQAEIMEFLKNGVIL